MGGAALTYIYMYIVREGGGGGGGGLALTEDVSLFV